MLGLNRADAMCLPDTLWASGYEIYDRISEPYQKFLESLTATFKQDYFRVLAEKGGFELYDKPRGAPENVGTELKAIHPVVRTNPVTGWKSIFPVGDHVKHINGVTQQESDHLLQWFLDIVYKNHDLQVRLNWKNKNDIGRLPTSTSPPFKTIISSIKMKTGQEKRLMPMMTAIWDNRSVFHTATFDYDGFGDRLGNRAVGIGERPYLDPNSSSRREALGLPFVQ